MKKDSRKARARGAERAAQSNTPPESGAIYVERVEQKAREIGTGKVVSVIGRYWSMDREENWDRIEKTYRMLVSGQGIPVHEGEP